MRPSRMRLALLALALCAGARAQIFDIGSPVAFLNVGQTAQLTPFLYFNGSPITDATFQWSSSDSGVLTVDSNGIITGTGLGSATVTLTSPQYAGFGDLEFQVAPSSIVVSPAAAKVFLGDPPLQFKATAYDYFNNPLPNAPFQWELTGQTGLPDTPIASIAPDGTLNPVATGYLTVHAYIQYEQHEGKPSRYEGLATVDIAIHSAYTQQLMLSNDPRPATMLRPSTGFFSGNDAGQLIFSGSLDGLASGAILYDGNFHPLITGGIPAPFPGGVVAGFFSAAINNNGQGLVAVQAGVNRNDGGLFAGDANSANYVLLDGSTVGLDPNNPELDTSDMLITPECYNDNGTAAFLAVYHEQDSTVYKTGIFRMFRGTLPELVWASDSPLLGVAASAATPFTSLDNTSQQPGWGGPNGLGIDNNDNVYFVANAGPTRGVFRWAGTFTTPMKVLAVGDPFANSTVKAIQDLTVLKNGALALHVDVAAGDQYVVLYSGGKYTAPSSSIVVQANPDLRVLTANTVNGIDTVLFTGLPPAGSGNVNGLYKWQGNTVSLVLAQTGPITYIHAATLGNQGNAAIAVRRTDNDFVVLRQDGTTIFSSGAPLNVSTPLHLTHLVLGSRSALPSVMLGDPASTFDITAPNQINAHVRVGDRLSDGSGFSGSNDIFEDASGIQYFLSTPGGLYQSLGGNSKLMLALNAKAPDGVTMSLRKLWAVNNSGAMLFETDTLQGNLERRLYVRDASGALTLVSRTGEASPLGTGAVTGWEQGALDDSNHVMMLVDAPGGSGLVYFDGVAKNPTLLIGQSVLGGEPAVFVANLKAAGGRFYARISLTLDFYHSCIAMFDGMWHVLVQSGASLPNGEFLGYLQDSDANANGDVIFTAQVLPSASNAVVVWRVSDSSLRILHENSGPTTTGDYLLRYADVNLRDDGTPYFLAFDVADRALLFQGIPVR